MKKSLLAVLFLIVMLAGFNPLIANAQSISPTVDVRPAGSSATYVDIKVPEDWEQPSCPTPIDLGVPIRPTPVEEVENPSTGTNTDSNSSYNDVLEEDSGDYNDNDVNDYDNDNTDYSPDDFEE